jgi:PAS domain S-box-containing protein
MMNHTAEELTGWKESEAGGLPLCQVYRIVQESTGAEAEDPVSKVLREGHVVGLANHTMLVSRNGEQIPISDRGSPVRDEKDQLLGVVLVFSDQRETHLRASLSEARLSILEYAMDHDLTQTLTHILNVIERMTSSSISFLHFVDIKKQEITLQAWSASTEKKFCAVDKERHHTIKLAQTGIWAEAIRQRKPVVHNDYASEPTKKGLPPGHAPLVRELLVPVIRQGEVVAELGVGNKASDYTKTDVEVVSFLADVSWEVTQRKLKEEQLHQSEERLKHLFHSTVEGIIAFDEHYQCSFCNLAFVRLLGYEREEEIIGLTLKDLFPEAVERMAEEVKNSYSEVSQMYSHLDEITLTRKDSSSFPAEVWVYPVYREHRFEGLYVTFLDITRRKQTEQKLQATEQGYSDLLNGMNDAVVVLEIASGRLLEVNQRAIDVSGYSRESLIGMPVSSFNDTYTIPLIDEMAKLLVENKMPLFESYIRTKQGETIPVEIHSSLIRYQGKEAILCVVRDISDRKRHEQIQQILYQITRSALMLSGMDELVEQVRIELSKIIDTSHFYVALYHPETNQFERVNQQAETNDTPEQLLADRLAYYVLETGHSLVLNKPELEIIVRKQANAADTRGIQSWAGFPLFEQQKPVGVLVVYSGTNPTAYDASCVQLLEMIAHELSLLFHRHQMIQDLVEAKQKAEESDRLKSAFLANVSHEIRTPMNGILGFMELLNEPDLQEEQRAVYFDIMNKSGQRLMDTINDIVELSKIESGGIDVHLSEVDLKEVMNYHLQFFQPQAREKGLELLLKEGITEKGSVVRTDRQKLNGILTNLLRNAIKFTRQGYIEFGHYLEGTNMVFYVKDTGVGIPSDRLNAVFDRFVQANVAISQTYDGVGLGLSIVRGYVNALHGSVHVESEEGKGSTFYVSLPYYPLILPAIDQSVEINTLNHNNPLKILVVEDDEVTALYLKKVLSSFISELLFTDNGEDAVRLALENPDLSLILMDIRIKGMSGLDATRQIRQFNPSIPIIALTAYALSEDRERSLQAGCTDHLSKPIQREVLLNLIQLYTGLSSNS